MSSSPSRRAHRKQVMQQALEARMLTAHARGRPIDNLKYDEVSDLIDVALARAKLAAVFGVGRLHDLAHTLAGVSSIEVV